MSEANVCCSDTGWRFAPAVKDIPLVTVAIPSLNQGKFIRDALESVFLQDIPIEVFVADGGSTDNTVDILREYEDRLTGWRSYPDDGQAAAINQAVAQGKAPYVCWLNSDDIFLPGGLKFLLAALEQNHNWSMAYGRAWDVNENLVRRSRVWTQAFNERRMANRCLISQPATLIRRSTWESVGGLDESLHMAMDYDLWWRICRKVGTLGYVEQDVACNREHLATKTRTRRKLHYREAMAVVRRHYGRVPLKWWLAWPVSVWMRALIATQADNRD